MRPTLDDPIAAGVPACRSSTDPSGVAAGLPACRLPPADAARKELHLLGVSFRTAPVAVRESLTFTAEEAVALMRTFTAASPDLELLVLSTCNRTEFYVAAPAHVPAVDPLLTAVRTLRPHAHILHAQCQRYQESGSRAARHLLRVTCGLDSAILGDTQILGQVKTALRLAEQAGTLGSWLQHTVVQALRAAKRARHDTAIGRGSASLGSAIAALVTEREIPLRAAGQSPRVLIIGAGDIARDIARHLAKGGHRSLTFINRTRARAESLAQDCAGCVSDWAALPATLAQADFIIAATACRAPVLTRELLDTLPANSRPLLLDAGVPRNIATGSSYEVLNIDTLRGRQELALTARRAAVPAVEVIVAEELAAWDVWCASHPVEGLLKKLFLAAQALSHEAAQSFAHGPAADTAKLERFLNHTFQRLLTGHARGLRRWARDHA